MAICRIFKGMFYRVLFACLLLCSSASAHALRVCYDDRFKPYDYYGYASQVADRSPAKPELIRQVTAPLNIEVSYVYASFKRCLFLLEQGRVDAIPGLLFRPDRKEFAVFPMRNAEPDSSYRIKKGGFYFYRRKWIDPASNATPVFGLKQETSFNGKIGVLYNCVMWDVLRDSGYRIEGTTSQRNNIQKLIHGDIDLLIGYSDAVDAIVDQFSEMKGKIEKVYPAHKYHNIYFVFSRQYAEKEPLLHKEIWRLIKQYRIEKTTFRSG